MKGDTKLRQLQKTELSILKRFKQICDKHHLRYYLYGGTLLGAVRHEGFIPWDDDVDVCMPYSDYEIFLNVAKKELGEDYFLQTSESDKHFVAPFAKIRLNNSTFLDSKFAKRHINHGIWIDIFPLIYTSDLIANKQKRILKICKAIQMDDLIASNPQELKKEHGVRTIQLLSVFYKIIPFSIRKSSSEKMLKKICSQAPTNTFLELVGSTGITFPCDWFERSVELKFEDEIFSAPSEYKQFLELCYGNYMELPPIEQRVSIHADIIDFEYCYSDLIKRDKNN